MGLYNWIQSPPAPAPALLYHPQYWIRPSPPLIQMPYFQTPTHPLEQDPEMVVILEPESETCSESVSSYPDPLYCDKYHICSGSVEDGWKTEERTCPSGLLYNPRSQECDGGEETCVGARVNLHPCH